MIRGVIWWVCLCFRSDDPCAENVGHKWTLSALLRHLKSQGRDTLQLMASIEDIVVKAILASANSVITACQMFVPNQNNCFELFGFDILIDEKLKPWLLEVNLSPSLGCDTPLDMRLKSAMLADLLTLVGLPAVDPILKPNYNSSPIKVNNSLKMKLGAVSYLTTILRIFYKKTFKISVLQIDSHLTHSFLIMLFYANFIFSFEFFITSACSLSFFY